MYEGIDTSVLVSLYDFYIFFFALFMKFLFVCFLKGNFTLKFPKAQKFLVEFQNLPIFIFDSYSIVNISF